MSIRSDLESSHLIEFSCLLACNSTLKPGASEEGEKGLYVSIHLNFGKTTDRRSSIHAAEYSSDRTSWQSSLDGGSDIPLSHPGRREAAPRIHWDREETDYHCRFLRAWHHSSGIAANTPPAVRGSHLTSREIVQSDGDFAYCIRQDQRLYNAYDEHANRYSWKIEKAWKHPTC
ncbi:hypothetical protein CALVIDRAFT_184108 [Calocera viscosa TUFC12733]|uniref:Uncharacterized protein n=1 Tax=Calocera viscosa (strain TUFC12733) TaxID=1330018 RepID=A0A167L2W6_CALVF|nr:hypothetical protein CALVIDRAFT_184108 [Calocera viscosa TUFC12733]